MPTDPQETRRTIKIALWIVAGFIVGIIISSLIQRDPYNALGSLCVSGIVTPICAFVFGFIGAWRTGKV